MNWYLKVLKQYADFNGRARRKEYWMFALFNIIFLIVAIILDNILGTAIEDLGYGLFYFLYALAVSIPGLAVTVRRLHDVGKSGWMFLLVLIPVIGGIWIIILTATDSNPGRNKYGPHPYEPESAEPPTPYEPELAEPPRPSPKHKLSEIQRLWMMFTSPGEVFSDIAIKPTWILIMAVVVLLGVGAQALIIPHVDTDATIRARFEQKGQDLSEAQIENAVEQAEKFSKFGPIIGLVLAPIAWVIMAAIFFVMLKLVSSDADYPHALSTTLHGYWPPTAVQLVLMAVLVQRVDKVPQTELEHIVKANLGAFLSADVPAWLTAAAGTISVFNIWAVVLLIIGFSTVGKMSHGKAAIVTLVPWGVWIVAKAALAAVFA